MSPTELRQYAARLRFVEASGDDSGDRICTDGSHSNQCRLRIVPVGGADSVGSADLDSAGYVVAVIRNLGPLGEARLGIPPRDSVFWLARRNESGAVESVLLDPANPGTPRKTLGFAPCREAPHPRQRMAAFRCCNDQCPPDDSAHGMVRLESGIMSSHTANPWFACSQGCCYADT